MKQRCGLKWLLGCLMLVTLALVLSGCYVTPDIQTGGNGVPGFPDLSNTYTTAPVVPTDAPTDVPVITDDPGVSQTTVTLPTGTVSGLMGNWGGTVGPAAGTVPPGSTPSTVLTPLPNNTATPSPTPQGSLKKGSKGDAVREVQRKLKDLGFLKGSVDGDFGDATEAAVIAFQKQYGLEADGKVGPQTLEKLASARQTARPTASPTPRRTNTPRPTATPAYSANTYLRKGDSGNQVRQLQQRLISLGYLAGTADGEYGAGTEAAVIAFQDRHCSYSDGVAGPDTLKELYSSSAKKASSAPSGIAGLSVRNGSEGDVVRALQSRLKKLGYYSGNVDGDFGQGTEDAVKKFQRDNGLKADGVAGSGTYEILFATDARTASQAARTATPRPVATKRPTATPHRTATPLPSGTYVQVTTAPSGMGYATLRRGYYGAPVTRLQQALKDQGYYTGVVDGYFGEGTESAVRAFQRVKGLNIDGAAGPATLMALYDNGFPPES